MLPDRSVNFCPQSFQSAKHSGHSFSITIGFWMDSMSVLRLVLYGIQEHMLHTVNLSTSIKYGRPVARRVCGFQTNPPKWTHQYHETRPMHGQFMACTCNCELWQRTNERTVLCCAQKQKTVPVQCKPRSGFESLGWWRPKILFSVSHGFSAAAQPLCRDTFCH